MTIQEAMETRHAVRSYASRPIGADIAEELCSEIEDCNSAGGLNIQLVTNEQNAFGGFMAHYGKFSGVRNYIALIGPKGPELDEKMGYYGERVALKAQMLGLNTCWVAMTFSKGKCTADIGKNEKLVCVLALGYGETQGVAHSSRPMDELCAAVERPEWFLRGMRAAMLAPTATNQQKFMISLADSKVTAKATGGFYSKVDLGIVKYHFEQGAGKDNFTWA